MIIPFDELFNVTENKYAFTRAAMEAVDKMDYLHEIPSETRWKTVSNVMKLMVQKDINYRIIEAENVANESVESEETAD